MSFLVNNMMARFGFINKGAGVRRFHAKQVINHQTVADHSARVALLCWLITDGDISAELLLAALTHDLEEGVTGDLPSPVKKDPAIAAAIERIEHQARINAGMPGFEAVLNEHEREVLKMADVLDGLAYCLNERRLGNQNLRFTWDKYCEYFAGMPTNARAEALFTHLKEMYDAADR